MRKMTSRQPPAFQCYASDWLATEGFKLASLAERGLLFTILCQEWVNDSLPSDPASLARLVGLPIEDVKPALTPFVLAFFEKEGDRLVCPELRAMKAQYLERREERSRSGRRGVQKRWSQAGKPHSSAIAQLSPSAIATPEMRREELNSEKTRRASTEKGPLVHLSLEDQKWTGDYDKTDLEAAEQYRRRSKGS